MEEITHFTTRVNTTATLSHMGRHAHPIGDQPSPSPGQTHFTRGADKVLHRALASDPDLFCDLLKLAFRGRHQERRELSSEEQARAQTAYDVLHSFHTIPGASTDGLIDADALILWVQRVRVIASEADRLEIADQHIGMLFAFSLLGADTSWPAEPVRDVVEAIDGSDLGEGLRIGVYNKRGVWMRSQAEGGAQERTLAQQYRDYAASCRSRWPRTGRVLEEIAATYEREGKHEDIVADAEEDRRF